VNQIRATVANMRTYYQPGVFAWCPETGEEYSANPADYWHLTEDTCLHSLVGEMILVVRVTELRAPEPVDEVDRLMLNPYPYGRCDSCGAPCDAEGCTVDREHEIAPDPTGAPYMGGG
jgi:hypothetical protein